MSRATPRTRQRIGLIGMAWYGLDADIRRGINRYRLLRPDWSMVEYGHDITSVRRTARIWRQHVHKFAGFIGRIPDDTMLDELVPRGTPFVEISEHARHTRPRVAVDDAAVGTLAARFLASLGLARLICVYASPLISSGPAIERAFLDTARADGLSAMSMQWQPRRHDGADAFGVTPSMDPDSALEEWMTDLRFPVGMFTCTDKTALRMIEHCTELGISIPEQVALLGCDNNTLMAESSTPTLSSIILPGEEMGHTAAAMLDAMIRGEPVESPAPFAPVGIQQRRSTDITITESPDVATALRYLRDHATEPLSIAEMVADLRLTRRSFQRRFVKEVGRTPHQELIRQRIELAKVRLHRTNDPVYHVALGCGFKDLRPFERHFRKATGQSPSQYRRSVRRLADRPEA